MDDTNTAGRGTTAPAAAGRGSELLGTTARSELGTVSDVSELRAWDSAESAGARRHSETTGTPRDLREHVGLPVDRSTSFDQPGERFRQQGTAGRAISSAWSAGPESSAWTNSDAPRGGRPPTPPGGGPPLLAAEVERLFREQWERYQRGTVREAGGPAAPGGGGDLVALKKEMGELKREVGVCRTETADLWHAFGERREEIAEMKRELREMKGLVQAEQSLGEAAREDLGTLWEKRHEDQQRQSDIEKEVGGPATAVRLFIFCGGGTPRGSMWRGLYLQRSC